MIEAFSVLSNSQKLDGGAMFGNAPRPVWAKWIPPDEFGRIDLACRCLLFKIDNQWILCETGIGAFFDPTLAERFGVQNPQRHMLLENLEILGLKDSDIDHVILSHLHFDHAGGLLSAHDDQPSRLLFPKAQYYVSETAWQRALRPHPRDRASFIPSIPKLLDESGRLVRISDAPNFQLFSGQLRFFETHGHTPGHLHTEVHGTEKVMIFAGDLIPGTAWVHVPITMGYDRYPELVIDEKTAFYERVVKNKWWIFYTHDNQISASQVEMEPKGKIVPVHSQTVLDHFLL